MSTKNRATDRDHNGRIRRKYTPRHKGGVHWGRSPGWWVNEFMTRPARAEERRLCKLLQRDLIDFDEAEFPHARKPHIYYW